MTSEIGHYMEAVSRLRGELEICNKNFEAMRATASTNEALAEKLAEAVTTALQVEQTVTENEDGTDRTYHQDRAQKMEAILRAALERYQQEKTARPPQGKDHKCTCGGEDSDGRIDVLRCPVHGVGEGAYEQERGEGRG